MSIDFSLNSFVSQLRKFTKKNPYITLKIKYKLTTDNNFSLSWDYSSFPVLKKWDNKIINTQTFHRTLKKCAKGRSFISVKSLSGKNTLILPCFHSKHVGDFTKRAPIKEQKDFWKGAILTGITRKGKNKLITMYTEGLDVGYFHLKLKE